MRTIPALVLDIETCAIAGVESYIEPSSAPANYKDPVKIAEYVKEATSKAVSKAALEIDLGRICAIGWMLEGRDVEPHVMVCPDEASERNALIELWREILLPTDAQRKIVSFNGLRFDLPYIMRRGQYLDLRMPFLSVDKYRSPHLDLLAKLSFGMKEHEHSLMFYAKRFGLSIPEGAAEVDGSMIQGLVNEGSWEAIRAHCASDVLLTHQLASRLGYLESSDEDNEFSHRQEIANAVGF